MREPPQRKNRSCIRPEDKSTCRMVTVTGYLPQETKKCLTHTFSIRYQTQRNCDYQKTETVTTKTRKLWNQKIGNSHITQTFVQHTHNVTVPPFFHTHSYLFIHLTIYLFIYLSIYLVIYSSVIYLSIYIHRWMQATLLYSLFAYLHLLADMH